MPTGAVSALRALVLVLAGAFLATFVVVAGIRLFFPYELEWIEGVSIRQIVWIVERHFPYPPASLDFLPVSKTPFYYAASAGLMQLLGVGFVAPRLLSIVAALGTCLLLFLVVRRETGSRAAGVVAGGLYAACYRFCGTWIDLAKVDSLFLFLFLLAFWVGWRYPTRRGWIVGALLFVLAYFTKQMTLPVVLVLAPLSVVITRGKTAPLWILAGAGGLAAFYGLDRYSQGWFSFYTMTSVSHHTLQTDWWGFWRAFLPRMWPACLVGAVFLVHTLRRTDLRRLRWPERSWHLLALASGLIAASWGISLKIWTWDNGRLPACLALALLAGLGLGAAERRGGDPPGRAARLGRAAWLQAAVLLLLVCQFALLRYDPVAQLPSAREREAAEAIVRRVAALPGDVMVYRHGFVNRQAGKPEFLAVAPLGDIQSARLTPGTLAYDRQQEVGGMFEEAIRQQRFDWVVLDKAEEAWVPYYLYVGPLIDDNGAVYPVTGTPMIPRSLTRPNPVVRGGTFPLAEAWIRTYLTGAWGEPDGPGRWIVGDSSTLAVALEQGVPLRLVVTAEPACPSGTPSATPAATSIDLAWNGETLGAVRFPDCRVRTASVDLPADRIAKDLNHLDFQVAGLAMPPASTPTVKIARVEFVRQDRSSVHKATDARAQVARHSRVAGLLASHPRGRGGRRDPDDRTAVDF